MSMQSLCNKASALAAVAIAGSACALPINGTIQVRTVVVDVVGGPFIPDPGVARDFRFANTIYSQIGINVNRQSHARHFANGDVNPITWTGANVSANLLNKRRDAVNNPMHIYYVGNYTGGFGQAWSNEDVPANAVAVGAVVQATRRNDTFAHEGGHLLVDRWRWRTGETTDGGIHSNTGNDLMGDGAIRNIPANPAAVFPFGARSRIGMNVGPLSNNANRAQPQISAMYNNSGLVTGVVRDVVQVEAGPEGGPFVSTGNIGWGQTSNIAALGTALTIDTAAHRLKNNLEQYTLFIRAAAAFALPGGEESAFYLLNLDSIDAPFTGFEGDVQVRTYANVVNPGGGGAGTLVGAGSYVWGAGFSPGTGTLNAFSLLIDNAALNGMRDVHISFTMRVPTPGGAALFAAAGLIAVRRRRD